MMKCILVLSCLLAVSAAINVIDMVAEEWETYKLHYSKKYESNIEDKFRLKIFIDNKRKIAEHNARFERGLETYTLKINKFADLLSHEFRSMMNGYKKPSSGLDMQRLKGVTFIPPHGVMLPDTKDWRTEGAVTDVKDQGHCGSCWSFSATGSLEGQHFRKIGKLVSLSEQNLIDCSTKYGNEGCNGGIPDQAFQYIKDNQGLDTESSYPYEGQDEKCRYDPNTSGATDAGFVDVESGNEDKLKAALATVGPVSVAIDASHHSFQHYSQGVYYEPMCNSDEDHLDHAVLVVGYGTENGLDYWLIKNSWNTSWGDNGYIKIARNRENHCGVATQASYPLV